MSSPSSPEDKDSKRSCKRSCNRAPPPTDENPFVKFKRFADSHITNVLHGIIGLPSVFKTSHTNSNWANLDEKMKKRDDELRAKVGRALRSGDNETSSTVAQTSKSNDWSTVDLKVESETPEDDWKRDAEIPLAGEFTEVSLYSPINSITWMDIESVGKEAPILWNVFNGGGPMHMNMYLMQSVIRSKLHQIFTPRQIFDLYGQRSSPSSSPPISLLPYLMYSPYSPLALTHLPRLHPTDSEGMPEDEFSYCDAFEDLLLASCGRPMRTWPPTTSITNNRFLFVPGDILYPALRYIKPMWPSIDENNEYHRANTGFSWIRDALHSNGLFWETSESQEQLADIRDVTILPKREETEDGPATEQEMYNRFLNLAGSSFQRKPLPNSDIENLVAEMHKMMVDELHPPKETPSENTTSPSFNQSESSSKSTQTDEVPNFPPSFPLPLEILLSLASAGSAPPPNPYTHGSNLEPISNSTSMFTKCTTRTSILPNGHTREVTNCRERFADRRIVSTRTETIRDGDRIVKRVTSNHEGRAAEGIFVSDDDGSRRGVQVFQKKRPDAENVLIVERTRPNRREKGGWFWDGGR